MVPESPRFLLGKGRHRQALEQLQGIAKTNKAQMPEGHLFFPPSVGFGLSFDYQEIPISGFMMVFTATTRKDC